MIQVREVKTKRERKEFVEFPLHLYKGSKEFVPALYIDEMALFNEKKFKYRDTCSQIFFNAYDEKGKMVGRIQGIIQRQFNELHKEKRCRFSRFDSIDDVNVSRALFNAVFDWAKKNGMDTACGPLGYNDLEREGLLIDGFDEISTYEEEYNYPYYQKLIEDSGFEKEVDWIETKLTYDKEKGEKINKLTDIVLKRYNLHYVRKKKGESKSAYIDRVVEGCFYLIDEGYKKLYGTVPFTEPMKKEIVSEFKLFIDPKYLVIIADENEKYVAFGLCFPAFGAALQKSGGRLTLPCILRVLKLMKHPKGIDLGLTAVDPDYLNKGYNAPVMKDIMRCFTEEGVEYMETNLCLEDNYKILAFWKYFNARQHKKRRSFVKHLD